MFLNFYQLLQHSRTPKALGTVLLFIQSRALRVKSREHQQICPKVSSLQTLLPTLPLPPDPLLTALWQVINKHALTQDTLQKWAQILWAEREECPKYLASLALHLLPKVPLIELGGQGQCFTLARQNRIPFHSDWEIWVHNAYEQKLTELYLSLLNTPTCRVKIAPTLNSKSLPAPLLYLTPRSTRSNPLPASIFAVPLEILWDQSELTRLWRQGLAQLHTLWVFPQADIALLKISPGHTTRSLQAYLDPGDLPLSLACYDAYRHYQHGGPHCHPLSWQQWVQGRWGLESELCRAG